jgi:hypothetical protein
MYILYSCVQSFLSILNLVLRTKFSREYDTRHQRSRHRGVCFSSYKQHSAAGCIDKRFRGGISIGISGGVYFLDAPSRSFHSVPP